MPGGGIAALVPRGGSAALVSRGSRAALVSCAVAAWLVAAPAAAAPGDQLLDALQAAPNEQSAAMIESRLRQAWIEGTSPAPRLLLGRAERELSDNNPSGAADWYDAALDLDPDCLPALRGRSQARLRLGDPAGALRDLQAALQRQGRDFAALQDLSRLAEARQDWPAALSAWRLLLRTDPHTPGGLRRLRELRRRSEGEAL